jgi:predicted ArsR family transcriptional regulator
MHAALAVASRAALMDALTKSERPLDTAELAEASGLHLSTVRFHLKVLTAAGLLTREQEARQTRGRPRILYTPAGTEDPAPQGYRLLATLLATHWAGSPDERSESAERAGRAVAWEHLPSARENPPSENPASENPPTAAESIARVLDLFNTLGFQPDAVRDGAEIQLGLNACPFRDIALLNPEVVCALHLGLLRGALAESDAPLTVRDLQPFVEPTRCVANIHVE